MVLTGAQGQEEPGRDLKGQEELRIGSQLGLCKRGAIYSVGELQESGPKSRNAASTCPPEDRFRLSPSLCQEPLDPAWSRKSPVQICELSSRGRGRGLAEGKAGAAAHWLEFGAVSAVPSSLLVCKEGGRSTWVTPRLSP